jgi:hypothetical protein
MANVSDPRSVGIDSVVIATERSGVMAKAVKEVEQEIRALSGEEKIELLAV